jgi:hypothetical protein
MVAFIDAHRAQGRLVANATRPVGIALNANAPVSMAGMTTVNAVGGIATFTSLYIVTPGVDYPHRHGPGGRAGHQPAIRYRGRRARLSSRLAHLPPGFGLEAVHRPLAPASPRRQVL